MSEQRIRVKDGSLIAATLLESGNDKPRIALIHSLGMNRHFWKPVAEILSQRANVLTIDCRGHGQSDKPEGPYSTSLFASDLRDVFDVLNWSSAVVAGASMGGCIALQFAADHPARTQGLGLVDTTAWYGPNALQDWDVRANRVLTEGLPAMIDFQLSRWFSDDFRESHKEVVQVCVDTFLSNDKAAFASTCHMLGAFDCRSSLRGIQVPTRIIVGEQDLATPLSMAKALKEEIPNSRLLVIPAAKHLTPLESVREVASDLHELLVI
jgi:3-oxoadipate enol-lactonase